MEAPKELKRTRAYALPPSELWKYFTEPDKLVDWWGPDGFTNTIHTMEVKEGGEWRMTMHGPDGTNYPNRAVYTIIEPGKKLVFIHFNPDFTTTLLFTENGAETQLEWTMAFATTEMRDIVVKAHHADKGLEQNLAKLQKLIVERAAH